jgi:hypothetical protein
MELKSGSILSVSMATDASGCQDINTVGMISISSMLMLSMESNMSVIYRNNKPV